mmetsp:Transcript_28147/g.58922  ORF Transcript_28147/g.58922 Transcript_28147/m.58922 type:complete len:300 (-) Transcript_28147:72-971(-)
MVDDSDANGSDLDIAEEDQDDGELEHSSVSTSTSDVPDRRDSGGTNASPPTADPVSGKFTMDRCHCWVIFLMEMASVEELLHSSGGMSGRLRLDHETVAVMSRVAIWGMEEPSGANEVEDTPYEMRQLPNILQGAIVTPRSTPNQDCYGLMDGPLYEALLEGRRRLVPKKSHEQYALLTYLTFQVYQKLLDLIAVADDTNLTTSNENQGESDSELGTLEDDTSGKEENESEMGQRSDEPRVASQSGDDGDVNDRIHNAQDQGTASSSAPSNIVGVIQTIAVASAVALQTQNRNETSDAE